MVLSDFSLKIYPPLWSVLLSAHLFNFGCPFLNWSRQCTWHQQFSVSPLCIHYFSVHSKGCFLGPLTCSHPEWLACAVPNTSCFCAPLTSIAVSSKAFSFSTHDETTLLFFNTHSPSYSLPLLFSSLAFCLKQHEAVYSLCFSISDVRISADHCSAG